MDDIDLLQELIGSAKRIVAFTGAGISTESGIPDFRSPGGIWTRYKPIYFDDFMASDEMRRESWRRKFATDETMLEAEPNAGHRALAKLVEQGRMTAIITQNVDGLHQRSGVPDSKVIELHGNATYASCLDCGHRHELDPIRKAFLPIDPGVLSQCGQRTCVCLWAIAERCDKQMDLHRNTADLHPAFTEVDLQLFAGLRLEPNCRTCRSNQLSPQRRNRAFHRTQTDTYTLLARQLLAHHIGIAGMATKTLAQPVR